MRQKLPPGYCSGCDETMALSEFTPGMTRCKECRARYQRNRVGKQRLQKWVALVSWPAPLI